TATSLPRSERASTPRSIAWNEAALPRLRLRVMLRRLETYGFHPSTTPEQVEDLARVLRRTGWFIPEVLDSAVGLNRSTAGVDFVWEHSYESPDAYARYMCNPYHICILDRYLLPEAPECIT